MINCLVVDDEPIAREGMLEHMKQIDFMLPVAACKNAIEASTWLQQQKIDLIFLDIQMPKLTGIDFVKNLTEPPLIVFTTAYPEYAIEGYELNILDYLLKPISFPRFLKTALKAQEYLNKKAKNDNAAQEDFFFIKSGQKIEKIMLQDVVYVEGMSNYVIIHTKQKKHISYLTFKGLEEQLPSSNFIRIHKSFLISLAAIKSIDGSEVTLDNITLPISKNYKDEVMARIEKRLFKR
jgi:DNA-binding LytR/AlgR family response regulator